MDSVALVGLLDSRGWLLLQERDEHAPVDPDKWSLVGGGIEPGETPAAAAQRELAEETGIRCDDLIALGSHDLPCSVHGHDHVALFTARMLITDNEVECHEGRQMIFVEPAAIAELDLTDTTRALFEKVLSFHRSGGGELSRPWVDLAADYEQARTREDSLDRLVEWPAQREVLGEVTGRSVLDLGCGNGGKIAELVRDGAISSVGVDISGNFVPDQPPGLELIRGDLSDLDSVLGLAGRRFDRILFLQSFGYAKDPVLTLRAARELLTDDGFILLTRTHPIRYAVERAEQNETSLGEEYYSTAAFSYHHKGWNDQITLTKRPYTIADLINVFSAAGLWIETTLEPQLSEDARRRYPHKQAWLNKYLGILIFKLRPR